MAISYMYFLTFERTMPAYISEDNDEPNTKGSYVWIYGMAHFGVQRCCGYAKRAIKHPDGWLKLSQQYLDKAPLSIHPPNMRRLPGLLRAAAVIANGILRDTNRSRDRGAN
jgi:hypothetical protein